MQKSKRIAYIEYILYMLFSRTISFLPRKLALRLGEVLGRSVFQIASRRKTALLNLDIAFGETSSIERKSEIAKASFGNLGKAAVDIMRLSCGNLEILRKDLIAVEGGKIAREAFERGRGVLLLGMHYGNWEMVPHLFSGLMKLPPVTVITRRLDNPYLEEMVLGIRQKSGNKFVYKDNAARAIISSLRKNEGVGILFDQNNAQDGIFADFFGIPASTSRSIGSFAVATGSPIIPVICTMQPELTYKLKFYQEIKYPRTGDKDKDLLSVTECCNDFIEKMVREEPELWLWGHKRWKTRPPGAPPLY